VADQFVTSLHHPISQIRLERYRGEPACDLHMVTNYFWNVALAESLHPTLHGVELALRNTVHLTLTNRYGVEEWWDEPHTLHRNQYAHVARIRQDYLSTYGTPITPGRMVAALSFGFWVIVLSGPHISQIWRWKRFRLVDQAFPYRAGTDLRDIYRRFNDIRLLRNRVMHHERIFDRPDLRQEHANIHQALGWISPDLHAGIDVVDRFVEVHQYGWERTYSALHALLGGP
jgi:hypothetical protein